MSAICGILRLDGNRADARVLDRQLNVLSHRGPDSRRQWSDGPVGLGHLLLRVTAEDRLEAQPLHDAESGLTLTADVRLDNRADLAAELAIAPSALRDLPDSALLLHAFRRWGEDCVDHLLGEFAAAMWDARARRLTLMRDHVGERALFFHKGHGFFAFASEIKGLWALADVPRTLTEAAIGRGLMHDMRASRGVTAFEGIEGVNGATILRVSADGAVTTRKYWRPAAEPAHEGRDEAYYVEAYRSVLGEAVACRLRRLVHPPGLIFSGGYDSAAIAGLAGPTLNQQGRKLVAAASVMPEGYRGTIRHARHWVELCRRDMGHLDLRTVTREGRSVLTDLEAAFLRLDGPASNYHYVQHELFTALAGAGVRLVMDGHGGDYTLNPRAVGALAYFLRTGQLGRFLRELRPHARASGHSLAETLRHDVIGMMLPLALARRWRRWRNGGAPAWRDSPVNPDFASRLVADGTVDPTRLRQAPRERWNTRARATEALERVAERTSSRHSITAASYGLELTRPFHDRRVIELAMAIPPELYVKDGRNRYLACQALRDIYPPEFQTRWRRNDDEAPDFLAMAKSVEPQLLAEIDRMEKAGRLTRYVDFEKVRGLLAARSVEDHRSGWEQEAQIALSSILLMRYVEWFRGENR